MYKAISAALAALVFSVGSASATGTIGGDDDATTQSGSVSIKVQPMPDPADCWVLKGKTYLSDKLFKIADDYIFDTLEPDRKKSTFFAKLDNIIKYPSLINCQSAPYGFTFAHHLIYNAEDPDFHFWSLEWAISKGIDLSIRSTWKNMTARERALFTRPVTFTDTEYDKFLSQLLPPIEGLPLCTDVDGQTPPAKVDCIVAENVQSSFEKKVDQSLKDLIGINNIYTAERYLSGTALYPGYKATITLTCSADSEGCGDAYLPHPSWTNDTIRVVKRTFGFGIKCNNGANLIGTSSIGPGESITVTHSSDTERANPLYQSCEAISGSPFTLHILTTRKAK